MKPSRSQLVNLLIGISILETIFVGALAVVVWTRAFPPTFHGWGEAFSDPPAVAGWAVNNAAPWERVEVHLFVDDKLYATQVAQQARPDVRDKGWARDEWHGYRFALDALPPGQHEARVYALHRNANRMTLQLLGDPISFVTKQK